MATSVELGGGAVAFTANPVGVGVRPLTLKGRSPSPGFRAGRWIMCCLAEQFAHLS